MKSGHNDLYNVSSTRNGMKIKNRIGPIKKLFDFYIGP